MKASAQVRVGARNTTPRPYEGAAHRCLRLPGPVFILPCLWVACTTLARADGGLLPPYGRGIWEPTQKAVLLYDDDTQTEDLILQVSFIGDTKDFAWLVPVPALPTLQTAAEEIFWDCAALTAPVVRRRGDGWGCLSDESRVNSAGSGEYRDDDITIYDEQTVGIYRTVTLGATDAAVLADSLTTWGYLHSGNRAAVEATLQWYVDKSWYFVAMRMDTTSVIENPEYGYWQAGIAPLRLRFASPLPVYPLRISALSAAEETELLIYVVSAHRMTFAGAATEYANRMSGSELDDIRARYDHLAPLIRTACFLTKLRATYTGAEMTDDITLSRAPTDGEFREIQYTGLPSTELLLLAMVGILWSRSRPRRGDPTRSRGGELQREQRKAASGGSLYTAVR